MPKITRANQKIFGSTALSTQIGQFGSLQAGSPVYTTNPETIQALSNYLTGWNAAVIGNNSPAIQDVNALDYLTTYQLAYIFQSGVPEWDDATTYYIGSFVTDGLGNIYSSIQDDNLNNPISDAAWWSPFGAAGPLAINPATQSPYTMTNADTRRFFEVNSANGAMNFTLPPAANGFVFTVKDVGGLAALNKITITRNGSENIEGLGANFVCEVNYGIWNFISDTTNWWLA